MHIFKIFLFLPGRVRKRFCNPAFTLVEIIVVVIIITILVLLTVPNIVRSRIDSNEFAAIANMRSFFNAVQMYYSNNQSGYPEVLDDLRSSGSEPSYISEKLASGSKSGYTFTYSYVDKNTFYINADPEYPGKTGRRYFYIDQSGLLRENSGGQAGENDPIVQ